MNSAHCVTAEPELDPWLVGQTLSPFETDFENQWYRLGYEASLAGQVNVPILARAAQGTAIGTYSIAWTTGYGSAALDLARRDAALGARS